MANIISLDHTDSAKEYSVGRSYAALFVRECKPEIRKIEDMVETWPQLQKEFQGWLETQNPAMSAAIADDLGENPQELDIGECARKEKDLAVRALREMTFSPIELGRYRTRQVTTLLKNCTGITAVGSLFKRAMTAPEPTEAQKISERFLVDCYESLAKIGDPKVQWPEIMKIFETWWSSKTVSLDDEMEYEMAFADHDRVLAALKDHFHIGWADNLRARALQLVG